MKKFYLGILTILLFTLFVFCGCSTTLNADENVPEGYTKVYLQTQKGDGFLTSSKYLNGYVSNDDIPILEKKSGDVKVYKDENLTSYIYYTKDELNELYISINEHYDPYDP